MRQTDYPMTPALHYLKGENLPFVVHYMEQKEKGSTHFTAERLGIDEHQIIKSIVLMDQARKGVMVLMHGDRQIDTKRLAKLLGRKKFAPAPFAEAHRWTGYQFGGTSPFGIRQPLPIYCESSILSLPKIHINGGKRGLIIEIDPAHLTHLGVIPIEVAK